MQELGEMGLHNMTCLFLTVAMCVDAEEVVGFSSPKFGTVEL